MDPAALSLLVDILDAGNLSEAARRLNMSRANVSYRLKQFEQQLGAQLLRRTTRQLQPTDVGLQLYEHGRRIRQELAAAHDAVHLLGQSLQGRLRLSLPSGYGQMVMAPWLLSFKREHPGIVLDVAFENRVTDLVRDEVDIAVRVISNPPDNLVARDMGPVRYVACAHRSHVQAHGLPRTLDELGRASIITSGVVGRQLRLAAYLDGERHEVPLQPTLTSENFLFLREAIVAGLGVGLVPDYVVADLVAQGEVLTTLDEWKLSIFGMRMMMLYMPNRHHTRAATTFIDYVLDQTRRSQAAMSSISSSHTL
ncbi:MAG: LysR family transcriptional regulator [Aquabacterium sp.]